MSCLIKPDMHHTWLCIMPCSCDVCLLCCLLLSGYVAIVRIRSTTSVSLLHGLVLLPCGISSKMSIPSKSLLSLLCELFALLLCCDTYHLLFKPPKLPCQPLTFSPVLANRCLAMLPLLLSPSYSVASCRWRWSWFHVGTWICWDITISLI